MPGLLLREELFLATLYPLERFGVLVPTHQLKLPLMRRLKLVVMILIPAPMHYIRFLDKIPGQ